DSSASRPSTRDSCRSSTRSSPPRRKSWLGRRVCWLRSTSPAARRRGPRTASSSICRWPSGLAGSWKVERVIPLSSDDTDDPTSAIPAVTIGVLVVHFLVFFYELALETQGSQIDNFINAYSLVPCEYTHQCPLVSGTPSPFWLTLFTSMFMHAGWAHILGNMLFLFVFGIHVERSMGVIRYLAFYLICGLGANALEIATSVGSNAPGLGASGAIAGVLAGYLLLYPRSHVRTLVTLGF